MEPIFPPPTGLPSGGQRINHLKSRIVAGIDVSLSRVSQPNDQVAIIHDWSIASPNRSHERQAQDYFFSGFAAFSDLAGLPSAAAGAAVSSFFSAMTSG